MVPADMTNYFLTSAAVAGSLIGLLFVSISLRYEAILGNTADFHSRASAAATFAGLANALSISLWALIPDGNLGYAAVVSALVCLLQTIKLHGAKLGGGDSSLGTFLLSASVFLFQVAVGGYLIARPGSHEGCNILAYTLFGAFASSLSRAWQLLQPGTPAKKEPAASEG
jgi:hypothetical protein